MKRLDPFMGIITANVELSNPRQPQLSPLNVAALVDTGAMTICIPEHVAVQLQLPEIDKREVTTAHERSHVVPYVGPIQIRFQNRTCFTGALVLGDSVLLGAVPMEDMDLVISPSRQTIVVNPKSPNIPSAVVKSMKDPIVAEVRQYRMEHTKRFNADLALICEDLRKLEAGLADRLVSPQPKRRRPTGGPTAPGHNAR